MSDVSKHAGLRPGSAGPTSQAAFLDFDRDGDLDLYVANYGSWKLPDDDRYCEGAPMPFMNNPPKVRIYCSPKSIAPARHNLYRNNGNGSFTDVRMRRGRTGGGPMAVGWEWSRST